jgi:hypothetical protein
VTYALTSAGLWVNRANTSWGSSRQYNVGTSFEQDLGTMTTTANTWHSRADQAWGGSRVWSSGQSFEVDRNAAYDSGTWGTGNLWSTDAHNDPNVWTNRYNAGVAAGQTTYQPSADTDYAVNTTSTGGVTDNGTDVVVGTVQVGITGLYLCYGSVGFNQGNNSLMTRVRVYTSPDNSTWTVRSDSGDSGINAGTHTQAHVASGGVKLSLTAGNYVQFRVFARGSSGNTVAMDGSGACHAQFIPTPANPH